MLSTFSHPLADARVSSFCHAEVRTQLSWLPKIDLHRHLEGSLTPDILLALATRYGVELPASNAQELGPYVQITESDRTLADFLAKFDTIGRVFVSPAACGYIATLVVEEAVAENVIYLELRFSPHYMSQAHNLDPKEVTRAVLNGIQRATEETNITCNAILIVERQLPVARADEIIALALECRDAGIVAVDLANDEVSFPPAPFAAAFSSAKKNGLGVTIHAAEVAGPENVLTAITYLQADRIGHGVRLHQSSEIQQAIVQAGIPLELCLTSNIQTGAVSCAAEFPLRHFLAAGVRITLNTDDPGVSNTSLARELFLAALQAELTLSELHAILLNSAQAAFTDEVTRMNLIDTLTTGMYRLADYLQKCAGNQELQ